MGLICMKYIKYKKSSYAYNAADINSYLQSIKTVIREQIYTTQNVADTFVFLGVNQSFKLDINGVIQ